MTTKESDRVRDYHTLVFDFSDGCRITFLSKGEMYLIGASDKILARCAHGIETAYLPKTGKPDGKVWIVDH